MSKRGKKNKGFHSSHSGGSQNSGDPQQGQNHPSSHGGHSNHRNQNSNQDGRRNNHNSQRQFQGQQDRHHGSERGSNDGGTAPRQRPHSPQQPAPKGLAPVMSVMTPRRQMFKKQMHQKNPSSDVKAYGVVFYDSFPAAKSDIEKIKDLASQVGQLNIVIRAETLAEDPELSAIGKVFAGAAWTLIHERRKQDGWYNEQHE